MTAPHRPPRASPTHVVLGAATAIALCTLALAACDSPQTPVTETASTTPTSASTQQGATPATSPFAIELTAAKAVSVDDYGELLRRYPAAQQRQIKVWYERYAPESMAFLSSAQWRWMQQHGYPTPDNVLRASAMTDVQLRELATHGDTTANFFYLGRLLDDYTQAKETLGAPSPHEARLRAELSASMQRALASGSAFSGYMYGPYYAALHGEKAAGVGRAAGLTWADSFGDGRAVSKYPMAAGFPGVSSARVAEVYFEMFAAAARINPYFLNARRGHGELLIPIQ